MAVCLRTKGASGKRLLRSVVQKLTLAASWLMDFVTIANPVGFDAELDQAQAPLLILLLLQLLLTLPSGLRRIRRQMLLNCPFGYPIANPFV